VEDDIRLMEILRRHGARASFNLNPGRHGDTRSCAWKYRDVKEVWRPAKSDLVAIYEGFPVANHTFTHPRLTEIPLSQAAEDIRKGREALEQMFGYAVTGFVYPFGDHNADIREAVREAGHLYGRTAGPQPQSFPPEDPMAFGPTCHFLSPDFWTAYDRVKAADGVFYFWGHSYEMMDESDWTAFEQKISRISRDPMATWIDLPALFAHSTR
jgi:peptidoglycan/xylan/chitin deacetylase (PgdA/CDA1 family)